MELLRVEKVLTEEKVRLVAQVGSKQFDDPVAIWFEFPVEFDGMVNESADVFVNILLIAAMYYDEPLKISYAISPVIIENMGLIQDIMVLWYLEIMHRVEVILTASKEELRFKGNGVLAFFSGGVDSFYTLLKSIRGVASAGPRITHILYMKGFEVPLGAEERYEETLQIVRAVAREANVNLITGGTNIRSVFGIDWGKFFCGAVLSGCGLALSRKFFHLLIPSCVSYGVDASVPWGSSPMLDALFGTEYMRMWDDGAEVFRMDKIFHLVGRDPLSLQYLRPCFDNRGGPENCGKCKKCIELKLMLKAMGTLSLSKTFSNEFDYDEIPRMSILDEGDYHKFKRCYEIALKGRCDLVLVRKLKWFLRKYELLYGIRLILGDGLYGKIFKKYHSLKNMILNLKRRS